MTRLSSSSLIALLGLSITACAPEVEPGQASDGMEWPGMDEPGADPWAFAGRIDLELCDGSDNDGDGSIDEGCTGTCDSFTTRTPSYWAGVSCVLSGDATGFSPFPLTLGSTETYGDAAALVAALSVDPGSDAHLKLRKQLIALKLNARYFNLDHVQVVDWDGDGDFEDVSWLIAKGDTFYDGPTWFQSILAAQFQEMNSLGTDLALWFDDTCVAAAEVCDGIDNDADGSTDEDCGCIETCGDSYDNDFDGSVDEGCGTCETYQSRGHSFWTSATCVIDGDLGFEVLPLTLGASDTYSTQSAVAAALAASTASDNRLRLRRQLLLAKINRAAFNSGGFAVADYAGDGTLDTLDSLIALGDTYYDSGASWQQARMADKLKDANNLAGTDPIWFRSDCAGEAEFCDAVDNDADGAIDEDCGCVEACDGYDNDFDGSTDETFPGGCPADELCGDGLDNDGDGEIDEADAIDAESFFVDVDSDTYGNPGVAVTACDAPVGYVVDGTDCNDGDAAVHPGATDVCDDKDNDCDTVRDEDAPVVYPDDDGDLYGDLAGETNDCDAPATYVSNSTDCDDTDINVNPGEVDYCGDGIDSDCTGDEVGCYEPGTGASAIFLGESAGDEAGVSAARVGDVDGDGVDDVVIGARHNDATGADAGAAYLFYGPVTYAGEVSLANADLKMVGNLAGDKAGRTVIGGSDIDGDGAADVTIGAPNEDTNGDAAGAAYVFFGTTVAGFTDPTVAMSSADASFYGRDDFDYLGSRTSYTELTGDATVDLLLSVTGDSYSGTTAGGIYVYAGPITAGSTGIADGTWAARITGETANDQIGLYVGTNGDLDGDGNGDVIIGVPRQDEAATNAGATYLVAGPLSGTINLSAADAQIMGAHTEDQFGGAVSFAGDQNADGYDDLWATAPFDDTTASNAGIVFLVRGTATLSSLNGVDVESIASATIRGKETSGQLGSSVAGDGDHDGDGVNDLLVGANNDGPAAEGGTYLFYGPVAGSLTWADADWSQIGETGYDHTGSFVAYGGDLRGLGGDTLIVTGREADFSSSADSGKVYLIFDATP